MRLNLETPILTPWVDYRRTKKGLEEALGEAVGVFTDDEKAIRSAFKSAKRLQRWFVRLLHRQIATPEAFNILFEGAEEVRHSPSHDQVRIGVVGHPYLLYDPYTSLQFIRKLRDMGVYVITNEMIPERIVRRFERTVRKIPFWEHERKLMGAAFFLIESGKVDGVINVSSFSCGTNSVTGEFITQRATDNKMPLLHLAFDEHTAEAGISTRLEAFVNLIKWKKGQLL
jgi:predicted nucleotide-binding protein (sugar kinase/HSP70/actin superfamily)